MTLVEEIHVANAAYVNHRPKGQLPLPPARKVAIVTVRLLSFSVLFGTIVIALYHLTSENSLANPFVLPLHHVPPVHGRKNPPRKRIRPSRR